MQAEALVKLKEAEKLYAAVNPSHYVNAEVKVWLAHCHLLLKNTQEAKQIWLEVVRDREIYHKYRPQGEFALNSLEHLIRLSILDPKVSNSQSFLFIQSKVVFINSFIVMFLQGNTLQWL